MKNRIIYLPSLVLVLALIQCKKEVGQLSEQTNLKHSLATAAVSSLKVETLYGSAYAAGELVDGDGEMARFNDPRGLQLMPDGILYVADLGNDALRKISSAGHVSTVSLQPSQQGYRMVKPWYIGVEYKTGTFHIIQAGNVDGDPYNQSWIFKSNGDYVAFYYGTYIGATGMARDPYTDIFYFSFGSNIRQHILNQYGEIYGPSIPYDDQQLQYPENEGARGFTWDAIAIGYNKVIYFTANGRIYKYTPGGITQQIFQNIKFGRITSLILNKDSRTLYLADNGYIKRIDGNKLTVLAGPKGTNDGHDGPALTADVYAYALALEKGENAIVFSDSRANTIRRIALK